MCVLHFRLYFFLFGAYEFIFICSTSDKDGVRFNVVIFVYFISFSSLCALVNHCSCWIPWKSSLVFMCDKWACISSLYHKFGLKHVRKSACFFSLDLCAEFLFGWQIYQLSQFYYSLIRVDCLDVKYQNLIRDEERIDWMWNFIISCVFKQEKLHQFFDRTVFIHFWRFLFPMYTNLNGAHIRWNERSYGKIANCLKSRMIVWVDWDSSRMQFFTHQRNSEE